MGRTPPKQQKGQKRVDKGKKHVIRLGYYLFGEKMKGGDVMRRQIWGCMAILFLLSIFTSGCHYFSAKDEMGKASQLFSDLKAKGGQQKVPYEYCSAEKSLEISNLYFGRNDYKGAEEFAVRSKAASETGLSKVK